MEKFGGPPGAGGGQFGVVTVLRFDTVPEPTTTRIEAHWSDIALVSAWQAWAPDAPDELTVNLSLVSEPGAPVQATLFGASTLGEGPTRELLRELPERAVRLRSEFFSHSLTRHTLASLLTRLAAPRTVGRREITFTAMGGAYNRVAEDATAFAHRSERFLLEHIAEVVDPRVDESRGDESLVDESWVDESWATAHVDGSGRVYPNFPDPALDDSAAAYHAGNYPRLAAVKNAYDPHRFFDFPQAI